MESTTKFGYIEIVGCWYASMKKLWVDHLDPSWGMPLCSLIWKNNIEGDDYNC